MNNKFINACEKGDIETIKLLLMLNPPQNLLSYGLVQACKGGYKEMVELLISKRDATDDITYFKEGLIQACRNGHKEIVELLLSKVDDIDDIIWDACCGGNIEIIELILSKTTRNNYNFGMAGAHHGNHRNIELFMILKGADIDKYYLHLDFEDIYYLLLKGLKNFGKYSNITLECQKWKLEFSNVSNELFIKDVANLLIEF